MIETEFNEDMILHDLRDLNGDLVQKLNSSEDDIDIRPFAEPNLIRLGYPYTFKDNRFEVTVAPGCTIKGRYYRANISLSIEIQYGQFQVRYDTQLVMPLGDWEPLMPQVELLINGVQRLKQKYDELAKIGMQASILGSLVEPYMKEIGLDTATLEVSTQGDFVLKMPIFNNAHLRTRLTFDNYKKCCDGFASIATLLLGITNPGIRRGIELERDCFRDNTKSKNSGSWQVNDVKMTYIDEFPEYGDFSQDKKRIGAPVYNCLSDLGYIFYVDDKKLYVVLNKNISLVRSIATKQTYFQYKDKSGQRMIVKDKPFVHLLRMTAAASFKTGYVFNVNSFYKYNNNNDIPFYDNLYFYLERLFPYNTEWNNVKTGSGGYTIYEYGMTKSYYYNGGIFHIMLAPDYYIKIRPIAGNTVDIVWSVMENWDAILKIPDILRNYPDFRLYLEDEDKEFELKPNKD